ncbi:MAG TPA: hypothetical protein VH107_13960, partial [Lacipirellulaceae bacterium]|nr:hypothetical protein [Lacipirellulaceae bacterium]
WRMNKTDCYHVYSGFALGLYVADLVARGAVGYRGEEILEQLGTVARCETVPSPSNLALIQLLPLSADDLRFIQQTHPVLARAANVVLESIEGSNGESGAAAPV